MAGIRNVPVLMALAGSGCLFAGTPLEQLFPPGEIRDVPSLKLTMRDRGVWGKAEQGLRRIDLEFTSFTWAGETWRQHATVLLPRSVPARYAGAGAIVANAQDFDTGAAVARYAEAAAEMGIPTLYIGAPNPGPHYGCSDEGNLMGYGDAMFRKTGDPHWIGYAWLARVMMRAITALGAVPGVAVRRVVVTGCSKRGAASWIAVGADDRIVGAFPTCWNAGNLEAWVKLKAERWGLDYQPGAKRSAVKTEAPAFVTTRQQMEDVLSDMGRKSLAYVDPYIFRDQLRNKQILYAAGTADPLFPPVSDTVFLPKMGGGTRILLVANAQHTPGTEKHLLAWKMWLAHSLGGRDVPRIETSAVRRGDRLAVSARVTSRTAIQAVRVWSASDQRGAYLGVKWSSAQMERGKAEYRVEIPAPAGRYTACYVEVEDNDATAGPGIITSGMEEIAP